VEENGFDSNPLQQDCSFTKILKLANLLGDGFPVTCQIETSEKGADRVSFFALEGWLGPYLRKSAGLGGRWCPPGYPSPHPGLGTARRTSSRARRSLTIRFALITRNVINT